MQFAVPQDCSRLPSGRSQNHLRFVTGVFEHNGCTVHWRDDLAVLDSGLAFEAMLGDRRLLFDFADRSEAHPLDDPAVYAARFKFHFHAGIGPGWHAFSPISFHDWDAHAQLAARLHYHAESDRIGSRQLPRFNAEQRRHAVQAQLVSAFGHSVQTAFIEQGMFWAEVERLCVSVCVPGYRNDILDRGQLQYMALGACTISPPLRIELPRGHTLEPGRHYLACAPDYADLVELVRWCMCHRDRCVQIGAAAKAMFTEVLAPKPLYSWVRAVLDSNLNDARGNAGVRSNPASPG